MIFGSIYADLVLHVEVVTNNRTITDEINFITYLALSNIHLFGVVTFSVQKSIRLLTLQIPFLFLSKQATGQMYLSLTVEAWLTTVVSGGGGSVVVGTGTIPIPPSKPGS